MLMVAALRALVKAVMQQPDMEPYDVHAEPEIYTGCAAARGRQALRNWLGFPGSGPGHARGALLQSNVEVIQKY